MRPWLNRELQATKDKSQNESIILNGLLRDLEANMEQNRKELEVQDDALSAKVMEAEHNLQVWFLWERLHKSAFPSYSECAFVSISQKNPGRFAAWLDSSSGSYHN